MVRADLAAQTCTFGAFQNPGQIRRGAEKILMFETGAETFREKLENVMDERLAQNPLSPLFDPAGSARRVHALLSEALSKGAQVVYENPDPVDEGSHGLVCWLCRT